MSRHEGQFEIHRSLVLFPSAAAYVLGEMGRVVVTTRGLYL